MNKFLISSIGWEPRFIAGIENLLKTGAPTTQIILFHPKSIYREKTEKIFIDLKILISGLNIQLFEFDLNCNDHVDTWNEAEKALSKVDVGGEVTLDITTMPRHLIWATLHFLEHLKIRVNCVYYPPKSYGDWLSSETDKPKMVYRHSGIAYPDRQTCLLMFSGFDTLRVQQYVDFFEPQKIILLVQEGSQFENDKRCISVLRSRSDILVKCLNSYSEVSIIKDQLVDLVIKDIKNFNIIATTVGPRCSALALYALNKIIPSIGLVYASSQQYNENYSTGIEISQKFESVLDFSV